MESGMRRGGEGEDEWYDLPPVPPHCTSSFPAFLGAKGRDSAQTLGPMTPFFILIHSDTNSQLAAAATLTLVLPFTQSTSKEEYWYQLE